MTSLAAVLLIRAMLKDSTIDSDSVLKAIELIVEEVK